MRVKHVMTPRVISTDRTRLSPRQPVEFLVVMDDRERRGLVVAAETVSRVKRVVDHLVWVGPISGMAFSSTDDDTEERAAR